MIVIDRILALSGALPDPEKHRRYLLTLDNGALQARLAALEHDATQPHVPRFACRAR